MPKTFFFVFALVLGLVLMSASAPMIRAQTQDAPAAHVNGAIDKLKRGKSLAGAIVYDFSLYAARRFAESDLDFIILDMEHQALDFERMQSFFLGLTNKAEIARQGHVQQRVPPIVRIPTYGRDQNEFLTKQVLDMGAMGIMFPAIESRVQALHAVQLARYPQPRTSSLQEPRGLRGNGQLPGAWFWGLTPPEYARRADAWPLSPNGDLLLFLQIETAEGVKNANEILSVPGIGVLFVGPNDLAYSLGVPQGHPDHEAAIQSVLKACLAHKVPCAITVTPDNVVTRLKQGFRVVSLPSGGIEAPMQEALRLARTVTGK
jgi:4-hydroxy-2-oxoheptanedioate aldolase